MFAPCLVFALIIGCIDVECDVENAVCSQHKTTEQCLPGFYFCSKRASLCSKFELVSLLKIAKENEHGRQCYFSTA